MISWLLHMYISLTACTSILVCYVKSEQPMQHNNGFVNGLKQASTLTNDMTNVYNITCLTTIQITNYWHKH